MKGAQIVFVSGLSGSGKSTAMAALEDQGFYCVDNLPAPLIEQFVDLCAKAAPHTPKIALALDAREPQLLAQVPAVVGRLRASDRSVDVLFLDCSEKVLVNRYRETRRVHPLSPDGSVEAGIGQERILLRDIAALADQVVDTSQLNVHELRAAVTRWIAGESRASVVNLISFGFRYGTPEELELLFDVRFLANPYFEAALRERTGLDEEVARYVIESDRGAAFLSRLEDWFEFLLPLYDREGKSYLTIGIGCTGGRHRSVAMVEALAGALRDHGREANVRHRDVEKPQ